jgi:SAM-dependent methyltransferase
LDIGCGSGELLLRLKELGCNAYGVDIDEITSKYLSETMGRDVDNGTPFQAYFFEVVVMRHSLEHVHNPVNALQEIKRIMRPNGRLIIGVPNIDSFVSKITGEKWVDLDTPRHLFHFTPSTVSILLSRVGFTVENIYHEFKASRKCLKKWMIITHLHFLVSNPFMIIM